MSLLQHGSLIRIKVEGKRFLEWKWPKKMSLLPPGSLIRNKVEGWQVMVRGFMNGNGLRK
jgi:hypothetical protein